VQVGAFSNAATAKSLQDKLSKQGLHAYTEKVGGNVRVRVGSFPTREAAEKVRHKLESQGLHPNVVGLGG
jgi:cell division septation protein DedD